MKIIEVARQQKDLLNEGIAYIAVWQEATKNGRRSWNTEDVFPDGGVRNDEPVFSEEQKTRLAEIAAVDPDAVLLNGWLHSWIGSIDEPLTAAQIAEGIKKHYETHSFPVSGYLRETPEQYAEREMRRMKLEAENVPDYSNRGQHGGDDIPDCAESGAPITEAMQKQLDEYAAAVEENGGNIPDYGDLRMTEREELGLGRERREDPQGENGMQASDVPEPDGLTVEVPMEGFTPEAIDRLCKMVAAKEPLLRKALDADELPISVFEDRLTFPWFILETPEHADAYTQFITALCKTAKEKKRVTAKEKDVPDNPKYALRCWLLSLGMIGEEYKAARKILLSRLEGNGSFKSGERRHVAEGGDGQ